MWHVPDPSPSEPGLAKGHFELTNPDELDKKVYEIIFRQKT